MPVKRLNSSACIVGDFLYVFGGYDDHRLLEQQKVDDQVEVGVAPPFAEDERSFVSASVMVRDMHEGKFIFQK